nr:hypothetical protein [Rhizobium sp. ACO-34A]
MAYLSRVGASMVTYLLLLSTQAGIASAQEAALPSGSDARNAVNASNNPLNPAFVINVQDYYIPSLSDLPDRMDANVGIVRALTPFEIDGVGHLLRTSIPLVGRPNFDGSLSNGIGDLTMFDIIVMQTEPFGWGVGPLFVAPTASDDRFGSGKWQAGIAGAFAVPQDWGLFGSLTTYQHSFAGDDWRDDVSTLTVQPFAFINLPNNFYLQSSGAWSFDLEKDTYYMPVGLGIGKHWVITDDFSINTYVEPQYSIQSKGLGNPDWQIFMGINFQYALSGLKKLMEN